MDLDGAPIGPVLQCGLKPHLIVESSPGRWHAYWLVDGLDLEEFTAIQTAIITIFNGDKAVKDLPRVMRLPGFLHQKDPSNPFLTRIHEMREEPPYSAEVIKSTFLGNDDQSGMQRNETDHALTLKLDQLNGPINYRSMACAGAHSSRPYFL